MRVSDGHALRRISPEELADALTAEDLSTCGQKWLARFTPFFTAREGKQAGCQHRLFFSQIEFCDNLVFRRRGDCLYQRLTISCEPSASHSPHPSNENKILPDAPHNGLRFFADGVAKKWPLRGSLKLG